MLEAEVEEEREEWEINEVVEVLRSAYVEAGEAEKPEV